MGESWMDWTDVQRLLELPNYKNLKTNPNHTQKKENEKQE